MVQLIQRSTTALLWYARTDKCAILYISRTNYKRMPKFYK